MTYDNEDDRSDSIASFCEREKLSRSTFHRMRREGTAPRIHFPRPDAPRISAEARREWHQRLAAEAAERDGGVK